MLAFSDLQETLDPYLEPEQIAQIKAAYQVAEKAHAKQKRISGEPYITHPLAVADILAHMRLDPESIMAALLHDVIEDTPTTKTDLSEQFGESVADLVDGVSKLTQITFESQAIAQAENFRKMLLAMVEDIRVIIIKLADRLHNMRTIGALRPDKKRRIALETLEIYAPIANRLGMHHLYIELEDLGFAALYPMRYQLLKKAVKKARGNRREIIDTIEQALQKTLSEGQVEDYNVSGRQKHLYSIYKKMRQKRISFNDIMDVYAFRVTVPSNDECYRTLGLIHQLYKPVPGRFKDYIAIPKTNSYQSLHTTLFGPYGVPIEIQIRTHHMHRIAENGIASHWLYKTPESNMDRVQARTRAWLTQLLEIQSETGSSLEFIENVKIDLFPDEVYVFTPQGDIMELPAKSTAVDFAYAVHTDIGNSCVACRISRYLSPLSTPLRNGQTIEIITSKAARPNPSWLNFVVTGKARSNIRNFLKNQKQSEMITLGQRLLTSALGTLSVQMDNLPEATLQTLLDEINLPDAESLYESIGRGTRNSILVAKQLAQLLNQKQPQAQSSQALMIKGTEGMLLQFAKCCWPIPGDAVMGMLLPDEGLMVHTESCQKLAHIREKAQTIEVQWEDNLPGEFQVRLDIELENQRGILSDLSAGVASAGANIDRIHSETIDLRYTNVTLIISVRNRAHLARIIRNLRRIKAISKISRVH